MLTYLELEDARYRRLEEYSTGMKQRLKLAQALVHDPPVLLLDEPTSGLDPAGREAMLRLLLTLGREHGKSLLLSTHLLGDVEQVCETVVILHQGRVLHQGSVQRAAALAGRTVTVCKFRATRPRSWRSCALKACASSTTMDGASCAWPCRPAG